MNILLVNDNPVVSRLLALCTREEHMVLEEVTGVNTIRHESYDVVFVDESSYEADVLNLSDILTIGKKVLLSNTDVEINDFDITIQKPFLPSQIIEILENIEEADDVLDEHMEEEEQDEQDEEIVSIFPLATETEEIEEVDVLNDSPQELKEEPKLSDTQVLDADELEKIKALLDMDEEIEEVQEELSEEELETRKVEAIKEQLIADGLEIVGEEEIVDELSAEDEVLIFSSANDENEEAAAKKSKKHKKTKSYKKKDKKAKKKSKKSIDFSEEDLEHIEDAVQVAMATLKRKQMKKLLKGKEIEVTIKLEDNN